MKRVPIRLLDDVTPAARKRRARKMRRVFDRIMSDYRQESSDEMIAFQRRLVQSGNVGWTVPFVHAEVAYRLGGAYHA